MQGRNNGFFAVPTARMRTGDFSELLNTSLNGTSTPIYLYQSGSAGGKANGGATPVNGTDNPYLQRCNGQINVLCSSQINALALKILNLYPSPNVGAAGQTDNTWQWDAREADYQPPPLGTIVDGGGYTTDGNSRNLGENFALSETHVFTDKLVNEFRFGYNCGHFDYTGASSGSDVSASLGLGGRLCQNYLAAQRRERQRKNNAARPVRHQAEAT